MRDIPFEPEVPKSRYFVVAVIATLSANMLLIVAFSTPYWLESYQSAFSDFVRLGLWTVCFRDYRHPPYHFDQPFDGCNWIFGMKYRDIRGWLQPGWFVCTQALASCGLFLSVISLCLLGFMMANLFKAFKVFILAVAFVFAALSALLIFLTICVFGSMCFDRSWIQYPNFNHLSWSYIVATVAFILEAVSAIVLLADAFYIRKHLFHMDVEYSLTRLGA